MSSRVRIIIMVVSLVLFSMGLSLWRYMQLNQINQEQLLTSSAEKQAAAAGQLVQMANSSLQERLIDLISREQTGRQLGLSSTTEEALNKAIVASPFQAIALLRFDNHWQTAWLRQRQNLNGRWPESYAKGVLQDLPVEGVKGNTATWYRVSDPAQQAVFLFLTPVKDGSDSVVAVGFLPASALNHVSDAFLSFGTELAVIDERGVAMSFTEQAYVGSVLVDSYPPVNEVLRRREVSSVMTSQNRFKQPLIAASQKIDNSNLYVIASVPQESRWALVPRLLLSFLFFSVALILMGVASGIWILSPIENAVKYLSLQLTNIADGQPVSYYQAGNSFLDPLKGTVEKLITKESGEAPTFIQEATAVQAEVQKMGAYKEISVGLAQALRDPLAHVLAQAQLARGKAQQEDLKDHFVVIERETRKARDTIENLLRLNGEDRFPHTRLELQDVVLAALAAQKGLISSHNVRVVKELVQSASVQANAGQLQTALEEVIKNSIEALQKNSDRTLKVSTAVTNSAVLLTVEDNGIGLEPGFAAKAFDPFFTTKMSDDHKGLGLTVAKGIVKSLHGKVHFESQGQGKGARVTFEFPTTNVRAAKGEAIIVKSEPPGDIRRPLTGTASDRLPTAPALDEFTFIGANASASADIGPEANPNLAEAEGQRVIENMTLSSAIADSTQAVTVRSPKTKEPQS